jgi:hypothetical protein
MGPHRHCNRRTTKPHALPQWQQSGHGTEADRGAQHEIERVGHRYRICFPSCPADERGYIQ